MSPVPLDRRSCGGDWRRRLRCCELLGSGNLCQMIGSYYENGKDHTWIRIWTPSPRSLASPAMRLLYASRAMHQFGSNQWVGPWRAMIVSCIFTKIRTRVCGISESCKRYQGLPRSAVIRGVLRMGLGPRETMKETKAADHGMQPTPRNNKSRKP